MSRGLGQHQREIVALLAELPQEPTDAAGHRVCLLVPTIAERTGRSQRTTRRAVESLRERGVVDVFPGRDFVDGRGNGACLRHDA